MKLNLYRDKTQDPQVSNLTIFVKGHPAKRDLVRAGKPEAQGAD